MRDITELKFIGLIHTKRLLQLPMVAGILRIMIDLSQFKIECDARIKALFEAASSKATLELVYTLVRVDGMSDANWDPFVESMEAFQDYNDLLKTTDPKQNHKRFIRTKLLYYSHLVEASAPHDLIANLLRCAIGSHYHLRPFGKLSIPKKENPLRSVPPGVGKKLAEIKAIEAQSKVKIFDVLDRVINENIRNSFFHSDYCLTDTEYRWTEGGPAQKMTIEELENWIERSFIFYSILFAYWKTARRQFGSGKLVHQGPNPNETFEMTKDSNNELDGFKVHFSNGHIATFHRAPTGLKTENVHFEKDGKVNFFCGDLGAITKDCIWNGQKVSDFSKLP